MDTAALVLSVLISGVSFFVALRSLQVARDALRTAQFEARIGRAQARFELDHSLEQDDVRRARHDLATAYLLNDLNPIDIDPTPLRVLLDAYELLARFAEHEDVIDEEDVWDSIGDEILTYSDIYRDQIERERQQAGDGYWPKLAKLIERFQPRTGPWSANHPTDHWTNGRPSAAYRIQVMRDEQYRTDPARLQAQRPPTEKDRWS